MEELSLFYEQIESLPCTIKEGEGVKELLDRVTDFQKEAAVLLSQEMPESQLLDKCLESGIVLDIELPEIPKLKQVIHTSSVFLTVLCVVEQNLPWHYQEMRSLLPTADNLTFRQKDCVYY